MLLLVNEIGNKLYKINGESQFLELEGANEKPEIWIQDFNALKII